MTRPYSPTISFSLTGHVVLDLRRPNYGRSPSFIVGALQWRHVANDFRPTITRGDNCRPDGRSGMIGYSLNAATPKIIVLLRVLYETNGLTNYSGGMLSSPVHCQAITVS